MYYSLFQFLMKDILRPLVPEYKGQVTCDDGERILFDKTQNQHRPTILNSIYFLRLKHI